MRIHLSSLTAFLAAGLALLAFMPAEGGEQATPSSTQLANQPASLPATTQAAEDRLALTAELANTELYPFEPLLITGTLANPSATTPLMYYPDWRMLSSVQYRLSTDAQWQNIPQGWWLPQISFVPGKSEPLPPGSRHSRGFTFHTFDQNGNSFFSRGKTYVLRISMSGFGDIPPVVSNELNFSVKDIQGQEPQAELDALGNDAAKEMIHRLMFALLPGNAGWGAPADQIQNYIETYPKSRYAIYFRVSYINWIRSSDDKFGKTEKANAQKYEMELKNLAPWILPYVKK